MEIAQYPQAMSYVILEFIVWNPNWDKYLDRMILARRKKYEEKKNGLLDNRKI